jgi:flagella basal body P-ring formation protein FlgA
MPRLHQLIAVAALACALTAQAGEGRPRVVLKERASATGEFIALRDVAELDQGVAPDLAGLSLGNAPWPGYTRQVTRVLVKVRMAAAGYELDRYEFAGSDACSVERPCVRLEPGAIVAAARKHLADQFPEGGVDARIELMQQPEPVDLPAGEGAVELRPVLSSTSAPAGMVRVDVDVVRGGVLLRRVPLGFSVRLRERVAVASRAIGPGERLSPENVALLARDVTSSPGVCVRAMEELEGKVAAGLVRPGQVLTRRLVADAPRPVVIQHNQQVFLVLETATLRAVTLGKAIGRARRGEMARAVNLSSGREVVGVAAGEGTIQVLMEGQSHGQ